MTSDSTQNLTEEYFRQNDYFGYSRDHVIFFEQFDIPVLDLKGKILMKSKSSLCWSPGNGFFENAKILILLLSRR